MKGNKKGKIMKYLFISLGLSVSGVYLLSLLFSSPGDGLDSKDPEIRMKSAIYYSKKSDNLSRSVMALLCADTDIKIRHLAISSVALDFKVFQYKPVCSAFDSGAFVNDDYCLRRYLDILTAMGTVDSALRIFRFPGSDDPLLFSRHVNALRGVIDLIRTDILAGLDSLSDSNFKVFCSALVFNRDHLLARHIHQYIGHTKKGEIVSAALYSAGPKALFGLGSVYMRAVTPVKVRILNLLGRMGCKDIDNIFRHALKSDNPVIIDCGLDNILRLTSKKAIQSLVPDVLSLLEKYPADYSAKCLSILFKSELKEISDNLFRLVFDKGMGSVENIYEPLLQTGAFNFYARLLRPGRESSFKAASAMIDFYKTRSWPEKAKELLKNFCSSEFREERQIKILESMMKYKNPDYLSAIQSWSGVSTKEVSDRMSALASSLSLAREDKPLEDKPLKDFGSKPMDIQQSSENFTAIETDDAVMGIDDFSQGRYIYTEYSLFPFLFEDHLYDSNEKVRTSAVKNLFTHRPDICIMNLYEQALRLKTEPIYKFIAEHHKYIKPLLGYNSTLDSVDQAMLKLNILENINESWVIDCMIPYENHYSKDVRQKVIRILGSHKPGSRAIKRLQTIVMNENEFYDIRNSAQEYLK
jgi:hypothetical protein